MSRVSVKMVTLFQVLMVGYKQAKRTNWLIATFVVLVFSYVDWLVSVGCYCDEVWNLSCFLFSYIFQIILLSCSLPLFGNMPRIGNKKIKSNMFFFQQSSKKRFFKLKWFLQRYICIHWITRAILTEVA